MESSTEAELVELFESYQKATFMQTVLAEMVHSQPLTPVAMHNAAANSIINRTAKKTKAVDMIFYWVRYRIQKKHFHIFWEERKKNLAEYVTKYHQI